MSAGHLRFVALPQNLKAAARCPYDERGGVPPRAPLRRMRSEGCKEPFLYDRGFAKPRPPAPLANHLRATKTFQGPVGHIKRVGATKWPRLRAPPPSQHAAVRVPRVGDLQKSEPADPPVRRTMKAIPNASD